MGKKLYDSVFVMAVDEEVRTATQAALAGSPLKTRLAEAFRAAGAEKVPTCLEGTSEVAKVAQLAAREWLAQVVGPYCAWEMWKSCPTTNRMAASRRIIGQIIDDDANSTGFVLLSNINKIGKQSGNDTLDDAGKHEEELRRKRQREMQVQINKGHHQQQNQRGGFGRGGNGGRGASSTRGRGGQAPAMECFFCGEAGHRQRECPTYAEHRSAAGGKS
jgi:hypothetical protein